MANILIVEDEKAMQDIIADYMRKGGHASLEVHLFSEQMIMFMAFPDSDDVLFGWTPQI